MTDKELAKKKIAKLIKRYQDLVNTNKTQKYNEAMTRKDFILPLFEALGWDIQNVKTPDEVTEEEQVSGKKVDYAFRINGVPKMFLEAKAFKVDLENPKWAEQAIDYAWHKSVTWAVLTDFEGIKIFNAEWKERDIWKNRYLEFKHDEYLTRLDELWLLSKESLKEGLIDREAEKVGKKIKKTPVNELIFKDLLAWRELLTKEIKFFQNDLTEETISECVQMILDRLIFIRVCEDRGIEPYRLRPAFIKWDENFREGDIYEEAVKIFKEYYVYDSDLFKEHHCEKLKIYRSHIASVINGLYENRKENIRYNFNDIPADVLGGIYEQYLGFVLRKGLPIAKNRKERGIYYTPTKIVDYIVKNTVGKLLKDLDYSKARNIKILDPACGSGSFLIRAFEEMDKYLETQGHKVDFARKIEILQNNIYGVDLDPKAVEIAKLNLLLKTLTEKNRLPLLSSNIKCGNSLISGTPEELKKYFGSNWRDKKPFNWEEEFPHGKFDVIIGNPPYIFARGGHFSDNEKAFYNSHYPLQSYQINTYLLFIDKALSLLRDEGFLGFIVPNTWLTIGTFSDFRKHLIENYGDITIVNIYDKVFEAASVDTCLLLLRKIKPNKVVLGEFKDGNLSILGEKTPSSFEKNNWVINISLAYDSSKINILKSIENKSKPLNVFATPSTGLKAYQVGKGIPAQNENIMQSRAFHSNKKENQTFIKYLDGKDVIRYKTGWSGEYLSYGDWLAEPRRSVPFNGPRILIRQIPSPLPYAINAVYTEEHLLNDINSMVVYDFKEDPFFLLAILNSRITSFWFANTFDKFQRKTFPQFKVKELALFPIPNADKTEKNKLAKLSQQMLALNKNLQSIPENTTKWHKLKEEIEKTDRKIDEMVYKLYGLTEEEIRVVEESTKGGLHL